MIFLQFWSVDNVILIILFLLYTETEYIEKHRIYPVHLM